LTESENEKTVRKAYEFLLSKDLDSLTNLLTDDFKYVGASTKEFDIEGFHRLNLRDANAFPDAKMDFKRIVTQGDTIVVEYVQSGTHKGELGGIQATNKRVEIPFVDILELENGKIKLWKDYCNTALIKQQLSE
jgi:steroid delta-isomerase-like uncharacterized protein